MLPSPCATPNPLVDAWPLWCYLEEYGANTSLQRSQTNRVARSAAGAACWNTTLVARQRVVRDTPSKVERDLRTKATNEIVNSRIGRKHTPNPRGKKPVIMD